MKCSYTFKIEGKLRPSHDLIIPLDGWEYTLNIEDGYVKEITVTVPNFPADLTPKVTSLQSGKVKAHIHIPSDPFIYVLREDMRSLEGLLALYGVRSIDTENPKVKWIPETEEEKTNLHLYEFQRSYAEPNDEGLPPLPFDLVVRSIIASKEAKEIQIPLAFFRKGGNDIYERRFIEAIYDFYFLIETCYGKGKSKNYAVKQELTKSYELKKFVIEVQKEKDPRIYGERKLLEIYRNAYLNKRPEKIIGHIVDLRGFLHHHSLGRKDIWHPEKQDEYQVDALFLQNLCFKIAFTLSEPLIFKKETIEKYKSLSYRRKG
ncbi:MAG: hypothetical protein ACFFBU_07375 [Promethearchaeota archaeon]